MKSDSIKPVVIASDEELFKKIMNWAKPIVMFDLPKDSQAVAFFFIKFQGMPWELGLQGLSRDDETKYHDVQWNWALNYPELFTAMKSDENLADST